MPELPKNNFASRFLQPVLLARILFILLTAWCGMALARVGSTVNWFGYPIPERFVYACVGLLAAVIMTVFEYATDAISSHKLLMAAIGGLLGLVFSSLFYTTLPFSSSDTVRMVCNLFFGYFGVILAIKHAERFHPSRLKFFLSPAHERPKILDSSVIIDGRIRELVRLQVVTGSIILPNFVLNEIQNIADSSEPNRKSRGRRGLEILEQLREECRALEIVDKDFPEIREVDQKLVRLARDMDADLITNDFNLQKIAQLHKITVINLNEISNALKPAVYIGEIFQLHIVREGKENRQGVGYLDDGTMVVVDDGRDSMEQTVDVIVTSILQTSSGRLVFARMIESSTAFQSQAIEAS